MNLFRRKREKLARATRQADEHARLEQEMWDAVTEYHNLPSEDELMWSFGRMEWMDGTGHHVYEWWDGDMEKLQRKRRLWCKINELQQLLHR